MIIDFHTHIFPDKIAPKTIAALEARAGVKAATDGTLNDSPWSDAARDMEALKAMAIPASDVEDILWRNASRLLELDC